MKLDISGGDLPTELPISLFGIVVVAVLLAAALAVILWPLNGGHPRQHLEGSRTRTQRRVR